MAESMNSDVSAHISVGNRSLNLPAAPLNRFHA